MRNDTELTIDDPFCTRFYPHAPQPPIIPFSLQKGDRLLLIGDFITEARRFSQILETYLTVCRPDLQIEVRNLGKGGETASGFLARLEAECLAYQPTAAVLCYGMNDAGYINCNRQAAESYHSAMREIIRRLKAAGVRLVLGSPGCIGRLPPWPFVRELGGTLDGVNTSLMYIRDEAAALADLERLPFVDHFWNLYKAQQSAARLFGPDYAVCGADDGVHPSWAGHVVMAYGIFKALGLDANLGNFTIDLESKTATTDLDHSFITESEGTFTFASRRYPFCTEGLPDKDWSIRSGMSLAPFNLNFNRMMLKVLGMAAERYRVIWADYQNMLEEWHIYPASQLAQGVNLADDFHLNPFTRYFGRIEDLVFQKQSVDSNETWHTWEMKNQPASEGLAECERQRQELRKKIKETFVPVTHNIRFEAIT